MKSSNLVVIVIAIVLSSCDRPSTQQVSDADYQRQIDVYDEQAERTAAQLDQGDVQLKRGESQADRMEALIKKWEEQANRQDAILDGVELLLKKASDAE